MNPDLKHRINAGRVAVTDQIAFFAKHFGEVDSQWKPDDTRVTFADFAISEKIFAELRKSFSQDDYCSEESNLMDEVLQLNGKYAWVLDPIDGTNNYALGLPYCGISLALLKDGIPVYGFIYDYGRDKLIEGGPGFGLKDGKVAVSTKTTVLGDHSIIGIQFPIRIDRLEPLLPLLSKHRTRSIGSGALNIAYTAIGILDGCIDYRVKVWDIAAGYALLIAGGGEFHSIGEPVFPLKEFHVNMPSVPCIAGSPDFCKYALDLVKVSKAKAG